MRRRFVQSACGVVVVSVAILIVWWYATAHGLVRPVIFPPPSAVWRAALTLSSDGTLQRDFTATFVRVAEAWLSAIVLGVGFGLALGVHPRLFAYLAGVAHALRSLPTLAIFPLTIAFWSISELSVVGLAVFTGVWVMLLATVHGVEQANPRRVAQARRLGYSGFFLATKVLWYESLSFSTAGARQSAGLCCAVVVGAEMFIGVTKDGVGLKILDSQQYFRADAVFVYMIAAATIGVAFNLFASLATMWLLRWQTNLRPL